MGVAIREISANMFHDQGMLCDEFVQSPTGDMDPAATSAFSDMGTLHRDNILIRCTWILSVPSV